MNAGQLISRRPWGSAGAEHVNFIANGLHYLALIKGNKVHAIHRVRGARYTSIAVSNPRFSRVTRVLWGLLRAPAIAPDAHLERSEPRGQL